MKKHHRDQQGRALKFEATGMGRRAAARALWRTIQLAQLTATTAANIGLVSSVRQASPIERRLVVAREIINYNQLVAEVVDNNPRDFLIIDEYPR